MANLQEKVKMTFSNLLKKLGLSSVGGPIGVFLSWWPTIKTAGKKIIKWGSGILGALLLWAAHFGPAAIAGLGLGMIGGGIGGVLLGAKIGGTIGAIVGGPIGIFVGAAVGTIAGIGIQFLIDKAAALLSNVSLPQLAASWLTQITSTTALTIAKVSGIIALGTTIIGTWMVIQNNAGAFIQGGLGEITHAIGTPLMPRPLTEASHLAEKVIYHLNQCGITYVKKTNWPEVETCLQGTSLSNKETIIDQFHYSVFDIGPGLQCVGFVRAIMAAEGKDPGSGYHAHDYLNRQEDNFYYAANYEMSAVQIGDLVIIKGNIYGHIGIVIDFNRENEEIIVAQAYGPSGLIQIESINPVYWDGFLRAK